MALHLDLILTHCTYRTAQVANRSESDETFRG
jgi:hypothetical protein